MNATRIKTVLLRQSRGRVRCALSSIGKNECIRLLAGYILVCCACCLYVVLTGNGLRALYGDTWIYTDMAKRIAFNHSLFHRDYVSIIIVPPLYPMLISVAYFFREQAAIFEAIKIVNILVYSSAFIPMFYLLKHYARLSAKQSFVSAILLLTNWCSLCYVIYISSEPLYCPLLVWFAWFLADDKYLKGKFDLLAFIFLFSAIPLTRAVGNLVFPWFAAAVIVRLINIRRNNMAENSGKLIRRSIIVIATSALIIVAYNIYLRSMLPKSQGDIFGGYVSYMLSGPLLSHFIFKPTYWFDRTAYSFSWILIGTGTVAVPLLLSIFIRNAKILREDRLAFFLCFFLAGTFALVPLITAGDSYGLACERLYDPYLFLFIVMLLKYVRLFAGKDLVIALIITAMGVIIAPPLTKHASCFALSQTHLWAVYGVLYGFGGAIFVSMLFVLFRYKQYFINLFLIMMTISIPVLYILDYLGGNKLGPNIFSFYDAHGITKEVLSERASNPNMELIVDMSWKNSRGYCKYWEYYKILINLPMVPVYKDLTICLSDQHSHGKRFMLLTHQNITNAAKIVRGRDVALYIYDL
ncbi:MAG: hypothetical protein ABIH24_11660 [Verrucomicrobiota bacterium]